MQFSSLLEALPHACQRRQDARPEIGNRFWLYHAVIPAVALALITALLMGLGLDFILADWIYRIEGGSWWFKETWFAHDLIHQGGRDLSVLIWLGVVFSWASTFFSESMRRWRRPLAFLAIATLLSVSLISALKASTRMDCPWDLVRYGGTREYFGLFVDRPDALPSGDCFPAAHASSGYCWVALYFFLATVKPKLKMWGLATGLGAGLIFGLSQQLRGAHFLSHDIWSLAICWFIALGLHRLLFFRVKAR